jgi:hypothetical protein
VLSLMVQFSLYVIMIQKLIVETFLLVF